MITKVINVNLHQPIYERLTAKRGDIASRYLLFHLLDGDEPFDLTGKSVRVYARKPDKTEIFNDLIINDETKGYCTLELTSQCLAAAGVVKMELYISEYNKVLTSIPFKLEVIDCINTDHSIVSTNEFTALTNGLASLLEYDNYKNKVNELEKDKATKLEVDVERKRIDLLTKINNGETEGNAELLDIRNGANGVVYNMAGENVRDIARGNGIVDKAIAPIKTNFLKNNYSLNLFDGNYSKGKISDDTGSCRYEYDENGKLAIIEIKPNTVYSVIKDKISRFNMVTSTKILKNNETGDGSLNVNLSGLSFREKNYTFTSGNNDKYLYVSVTINKDEDVFLQVVEGIQTELTTNGYSFIPNDNLEIYSKAEIDRKVFSFKNVDFLERSDINLYDGGTYFENRKIGGASPNMFITSSNNCRTAAVEIKPNTTYSIILEDTTLLDNGRNYFKILTSSKLYDNSDQWAEGKNIDLIIHARHYTFKSGNNDRYLYIFYTDKNEECLIQVVEGVQTNFSVTSYDPIANPKKNLNVFNKNEVLDLIKNNAANGRDVKCIKTGKNLEIYVPSKTSSNYIRYSYNRIDDNNINMHQWRVLKTYLVDKSFNVIFDFDGQTEWEGAILEQGASDFIGGFHGDENNVFLSVLIDGKEYDINGDDFNVDVKNEIRIVNNSILNRCNTPNDNVFNRYKVNIWTKDNYIVENRYIALQDFKIASSKVSLMSMKYTNESDGKEIVSQGRYDYDYLKTDFTNPFANTGCGIPRKNVKRMEMWGETSGMYARLECVYDYDKYPNRQQHVEDFRDQNRAKFYFDLTGQYTIQKDEELICKSIFTLMG